MSPRGLNPAASPADRTEGPGVRSERTAKGTSWARSEFAGQQDEKDQHTVGTVTGKRRGYRNERSTTWQVSKRFKTRDERTIRDNVWLEDQRFQRRKGVARNALLNGRLRRVCKWAV